MHKVQLATICTSTIKINVCNGNIKHKRKTNRFNRSQLQIQTEGGTAELPNGKLSNCRHPTTALECQTDLLVSVFDTAHRPIAPTSPSNFAFDFIWNFAIWNSNNYLTYLGIYQLMDKRATRTTTGVFRVLCLILLLFPKHLALDVQERRSAFLLLCWIDGLENEQLFVRFDQEAIGGMPIVNSFRSRITECPYGFQVYMKQRKGDASVEQLLEISQKYFNIIGNISLI